MPSAKGTAKTTIHWAKSLPSVALGVAHSTANDSVNESLTSAKHRVLARYMPSANIDTRRPSLGGRHIC
jgi:hypothetical protein